MQLKDFIIMCLNLLQEVDKLRNSDEFKFFKEWLSDEVNYMKTLF